MLGRCSFYRCGQQKKLVAATTSFCLSTTNKNLRATYVAQFIMQRYKRQGIKKKFLRCLAELLGASGQKQEQHDERSFGEYAVA